MRGKQDGIAYNGHLARTISGKIQKSPLVCKNSIINLLSLLVLKERY